MTIGIDISQLAYGNTGVAVYLENFITNLFKVDNENNYVLFFSSLRAKAPKSITSLKKPNIKFKNYKFPPIVLDILWNKIHVIPIEWLIGKIDIFITSDWTEPPVYKAKKATILYDLIIYKYPEETDQKIIKTQKRKLKWVVKESELVLCISQSTSKDAQEILGLEPQKLKVLYPGI
jgi:hypothetical protein